MRAFRYVVVDVFAERALEGNALAVFTDARALEEPALQALARELNLSETVFVYPPAGDGHARIRIFTPTTEVRFAGHPVLGTAFVLGGPMQLVEVRLETETGIVPVMLEREGSKIVFGRMRQPIPSVAPFEDVPSLLAALGVARSLLPVEVYDNGLRHVFVSLESEAEVASLVPDLPALGRRSSGAAGPLTVSCFAVSGTRVKTRVFVPGAGVPEDPATGSAAGPLACHLARHGVVPFGEEVEIAQGAEVGRPSTLYARAEGGAQGVEAVEVGGSAVVVARGEFRV